MTNIDFMQVSIGGAVIWVLLAIGLWYGRIPLRSWMSAIVVGVLIGVGVTALFTMHYNRNSGAVLAMGEFFMVLIAITAFCSCGTSLFVYSRLKRAQDNRAGRQ